MASSLPFIFHIFLYLLSFLHHPPFSSANLHKTKSRFRSLDIPKDNDDAIVNGLISTSTLSTAIPPTTIFEVARPIQLPNTKPITYLILQHDFAFTYTKPPAFANYTPPSNFQSQKFEKIVLELKGTSKGVQYDRIFGVWLGGVEILRSCTAEPTPTGVIWTVEKDITRYYSLLMTNQTLAVFLGNLVNNDLTGVYHLNVSMHFYPSEQKNYYGGLNVNDATNEFNSGPADLILPISRDLPLNDGLWFEIQNSDVQSKQFKIPQNVYRAVLEVYVSFHESDEFWYTNFYNDYIAANNLSGTPGNGPFREVIVSLDGVVAGSVWPFTVIFTGGFYPRFWTPITGIGSFDLPSYNIEMTPFLGKILDAKTHAFGFSVTNALNVWYIDANLHLWLDKQSAKTEGMLIAYHVTPVNLSSVSNFNHFDGTFSTNATRAITSSGWVRSSYGTIITNSTQEFNYTSFMLLGNELKTQVVNQTIDYKDKVVIEMPSSSVRSATSLKSFPFSLYNDVVDQGNGTSIHVKNVSLGFNEEKEMKSDQGVSVSSLKNVQKAQRSILVKGNVFVSGSWSTKQIYSYDEDNKLCYFRNISSSIGNILYDEVSNSCSIKQLLGPFPRI